MAVRLHRCSTMWVKISAHPCWKVQKALDDAGIEYVVIKHPVSRSKRTDYIELTGQNLLPAIELEDGTVIRRESRELVEMIRSGQLRQGAATSPPATPSG
jgi:glutathione S-transferase